MEIATLNTKYLTRSPLKVKVIRVDSPSLFWVQLNNSQEDFEDMMEDLAYRMKRRKVREMPLCHYLCCITESPDEELSTPVQAEDQWNAYRYLRNLRCVIVLEECRVYQHNSSFIKICNDCYEREATKYKKQFLPVFSHSLTHQSTVHNQTRCTTCNKPIACIQPAEDCLSCIESFIQADKAHLDPGWGVPSVSSI
ncbi:hypothetical protein ALC57_13135 [Trachymyrmex cornetzi]|uniref:Uncharacterized protein n=1 Tax=Trachymyrmex cornetzi TaxID=471704 RepID=A0A151IZW2_9HYME|nr:hypothetical protein ALC57_13135 [Trachymyrmex cornetzi]